MRNTADSPKIEYEGNRRAFEALDDIGRESEVEASLRKDESRAAFITVWLGAETLSG